MNRSANISSYFISCCKSLFTIMCYGEKQTLTILLVTAILCLQMSPTKFTVDAVETAAAQPRTRPRTHRNPGCDLEQQNKMTEEYRKCQTEFTQRHHQNTGKALTTLDHQVKILKS